MPRKQRFKPSRKPQAAQASVASQAVDDRKEINPEEQASSSSEGAEQQPSREIERE